MPTLDFKGKPFVYSHHLSVPYRELIIDEEKSLPPKGEEPSLDDNLIIHGDNLEALKTLLPRYAGKVDVIYIDPPYNTGNEGWAYNDNVNAPQLKEWLGNVVDAEDMERHDKWLCMMWPRLRLMHDLLSDTGFIAISLDENEAHRLWLLMDEIFGEENRVGIFSVVTPNQTSDSFKTKNTDYLIIYSKTDAVNLCAPLIEQEARCTTGKLDQTQPEIEFPAGISVHNLPDGEYEQPRQIVSGKENIQLISGKLVVKKGKLASSVTLKARWSNPNDIKRWISKVISKDDKRIFNKFGKELVDFWFEGDRFQPRMRKIGFQIPYTFIDDLTSKGGTELTVILGSGKFAYPKHSDLPKFAIDLHPNKQAIVLDSFAGSGTTAHSVLRANQSDGGNRKFILVETEDYADTLTAERVRRVIKGVSKARDDNLRKGLGGSFTYCELGEPMDMERFFAEDDKAPAFDQVARYVAYTATGDTLVAAEGPDGFAGRAGNYRLHLFYRPDPAWMRSNQAMLDLATAERIADAAKIDGGKPVLVFAAGKLMGQRVLTGLGLTFCQLPYSVHRILGDGTEGVAGVDAA